MEVKIDYDLLNDIYKYLGAATTNTEFLIKAHPGKSLSQIYKQDMEDFTVAKKKVELILKEHYKG